MTPMSKLVIAALSGVVLGSLITSATAPYHPKIVVDPALPVPRVAVVPPAPPVIHIPAVYDGCSHCSETARKLAWSIDNEPQRWTVGEFELTRNDGLVIWTSNGAWDLTAGHTTMGKGWDGGHEESGGGLSATPDQALVWRAYQRLAAKRAAQ